MNKIIFEDERNFHIFENKVLNWHTHIHNNIEIVALHSGTVDFYLENKHYHMSAGDISIAFPNQIHGYKNGQNIDSTVIIFGSDFFYNYGDTFSSRLPIYPIISNNTDDIFKIINMFFPKYYENTSQDIIVAFLQVITGLILSRLELAKKAKDNESTPVKLLCFCNEHYMEPITINDAAVNLNISISHVANIFKNKLHTTFTDYIQEKRIEYACEVLKSGTCNITETAYVCGFNSLRTFGRVFKKYMGISPKSYIKNYNVNIHGSVLKLN